MENTEIWKDIQGYEGLYQVSNLGKVKSLWFGKERVLKQTISNNGYFQVVLCKDGKRKYYLTHRLVATTFLPNPDNLSIINHKDEVKTNNCVSNLEWCTQEYNINYGTRNERVGKSMIGKNKGKILSQEHKENISKALSKPIFQFNREGNKIIGKYNSVRQVERELKINQSSITYCCKGKRKTAGGYRWMYLEDYVNRMEKLYNMILKKAS